jgi:GntR family transcriptional regulator
MNQPLRIKKTSVVQQAIERLKSYVSELSLAGVSRLPSEAELTGFLGISRLTVREALVVLERDGFVTRSHGKSTIINGFIQRLRCRIDINRDIDAFLESKGHRTHSEVLSHAWRAAGPEEAERLGIVEGAELLVVKKVFMADEIAVALYIDRVPRSLFRHERFNPDDFVKSMFPLVEETCGCRITHDVVEIAPTTADKKLSELFAVPPRSPILRADVLEYTDEGIAVMYNTEFYHDKFIRFTLCRTIQYATT